MALLAVLPAIGLLTATGAFGAVQAERTLTVNVAGDAAALLQIQSLDDEYASANADGVLQIDFSSSGLSNAEEVNPNASTVVPRLFNVTNQGTNSISLNYTKSGTSADSVLLLNSTNSNANSQDPLHDGSGQDLPTVLSVGQT
jgi:P pilus assembly chaperone PapD